MADRNSYQKRDNNVPESEKTVHAPYNFVPFMEREPYMRYTDIGELPAHDELHADLLTGEIHLTLTAETRIFVSDGQKDADFFRGANGNYMVPGSTIRGMARENMQILGDGLVLKNEDLEDTRIFYRRIADPKTGVKGQLKTYYTKKSALDVGSVSYYKYNLPRNVYPGYLKKCGAGNNAPYRIYKTNGNVLFASRKLVHDKIKNLNDHDNYKAHIVKVGYTGIDTDKQRIVTDIWRADTDPNKGKIGVLLYTGKPISRTDPKTHRKKENHLYVFPQFDESQPYITLSDEDRIAYEMDCRACKKKGSYILTNMKENDVLPVFYVQTNDAHGKQHTYFGLTQYPRIGHTHMLSDGLPKEQLDQYEAIQKGKPPLDYPHAILGFTYTFQQDDGNKQTTAYRSRVSFGDFEVTDPNIKTDSSQPIILAEPKPSFFAGYTEGGRHYSQSNPEQPWEADFRLRGFKQYWMKNDELIPGNMPNMQNAFRPLPANTQFTGVVRFKNLHEDELGLLLWSLVLNENDHQHRCQTIGKGKPYGFGRVHVQATQLNIWDMNRMYSAAGFSGCTREPKTCGQFIEDYKSYIQEKTAVPIEDRAEWKAFFYMKERIWKNDERAKVSYIPLNGDRDMKKVLPTVVRIQNGK